MSSLVPDSTLVSVSPLLALAPYLEDFLEGRRVVALGDAISGLADSLMDRGARTIQWFDPDPGRVSRATITHASKGVSFATWGESDHGIRDGAFDVGVVADISLFHQPSKVLQRIRRMLAPRGVILVATPNKDRYEGNVSHMLGYYELYDVVTKYFQHVRMVGHVPFYGVALVDFALAGQGEVSVDTSLVEGQAPEPSYFLAVGSDRRLSPDAYSLVQLPQEALADGEEPYQEILEDQRIRMAEVQAAAQVTAAELDSIREARIYAESKVNEERRRVEELSRALSERYQSADGEEAAQRMKWLQGQLEVQQVRSQSFADKLRDKEQQIVQLQSALQEGQERLKQATSKVDLLKRSVSELESKGRGVPQQEHEKLKGQFQATQERSRKVEAEAKKLQASHEKEYAAVEDVLRERAREITTLRQEVHRRGELVQELLQALEGTPLAIEGTEGVPSSESGEVQKVVVPVVQGASDSPKLLEAQRELVEANRLVEELTLQVAEREGQLYAALWKVNELQRMLKDRQQEISVHVEQALDPVRVELDAKSQRVQELEKQLHHEHERFVLTQQELDLRTQELADAQGELKFTRSQQTQRKQNVDESERISSEFETMKNELRELHSENDALKKALLQEREDRLNQERQLQNGAVDSSLAVLLAQVEAERLPSG
jgi:SAM-dependent methyltransferase